MRLESKCPACGTSVQPRQGYCSYCGYDLKRGQEIREREEDEDEEGEAENRVVITANISANIPSARDESTNGKACAIGCIILVGLAAFVGMVFRTPTTYCTIPGYDFARYTPAGYRFAMIFNNSLANYGSDPCVIYTNETIHHIAGDEVVTWDPGNLGYNSLPIDIDRRIYIKSININATQIDLVVSNLTWLLTEDQEQHRSYVKLIYILTTGSDVIEFTAGDQKDCSGRFVASEMYHYQTYRYPNPLDGCNVTLNGGLLYTTGVGRSSVNITSIEIFGANPFQIYFIGIK